MAGDEKHARELIDRLRKSFRSLDGVVVVSPRLLAEVADALEAALPGDDDWEWGCDAGPGEFVPAWNNRADAAWAVAKQRGSRLVRRRSAGPWEPVEEVPRG